MSKRISERNMEQKNERKRKKALWTREEENKLQNYVEKHGPGQWETVSRVLNIGKSANSCRLKWFNYLDPKLVRAKFTDEEMLKILKLRFEGNGWSKIAEDLPGRTDNEIKNFCNSKRMKKEAERLNWDVTSHEFLQKMTSTLTQRIQLPVDHIHTTGGNGLKAEMSVSTGSSDVVDCTYQELMMSSDIIHGPNADQNCGSCHGESIWAFVEAVLDGRIILPAHHDWFDIDNY